VRFRGGAAVSAAVLLGTLVTGTPSAYADTSAVDTPPVGCTQLATNCVFIALTQQAAAGSFDGSNSSTAFLPAMQVPVAYFDDFLTAADGVTVPDVTKAKHCETDGYAGAQVNKPAGTTSIAEDGNLEADTTCPAYVIQKTTIDLQIIDTGAPGATTHSVTDTSSSTGADQAYVTAHQDVDLYQPPTDYHGYGSTIYWEYHMHVAYNPKHSTVTSADLCYEVQADYTPSGPNWSNRPVNCP
jgi:hypothetical protein